MHRLQQCVSQDLGLCGCFLDLPKYQAFSVSFLFEAQGHREFLVPLQISLLGLDSEDSG